jgi:hypothetical protein
MTRLEVFLSINTTLLISGHHINCRKIANISNFHFELQVIAQLSTIEKNWLMTKLPESRLNILLIFSIVVREESIIPVTNPVVSSMAKRANGLKYSHGKSTCRNAYDNLQ